MFPNPAAGRKYVHGTPHAQKNWPPLLATTPTDRHFIAWSPAYTTTTTTPTDRHFIAWSPAYTTTTTTTTTTTKDN